MEIFDYEIGIWESAKNCDAARFLSLAEPDAVMVCGGMKNSGKEYAEFIHNFDVADYEISNRTIVAQTEDMCQIYYIVDVKVADERNADLAGKFNVTSTWMRRGDTWKLVYNMDSRLPEVFI